MVASPLGSLGEFTLPEAVNPVSCCCVPMSKLPPVADWDCCDLRGPDEAGAAELLAWAEYASILMLF